MPPSGSTAAARSASALAPEQMSSPASSSPSLLSSMVPSRTISLVVHEVATYQLLMEASLRNGRRRQVGVKSCLQDASCSQACASESSHQLRDVINLTHQHHS